MYHRVAELESDVWRLAVSPVHFEQHLQMLHRNWYVMPLTELVENLLQHKLKKNSIAITFDDGYADNFLVARPLLEKYQLPATFFISSGSIGTEQEFWWDELEHLLLFSETLPQSIALQIGETWIEQDLGEERELSNKIRQQHSSWKAYVNTPPTLRSALYLKIWKQLRPLSHQAQQECLHKLKTWSGMTRSTRSHYQSMTLEQLQALGQSHLFHLGAHTASHLDLACHDVSVQSQEFQKNKAFLEKISGNTVELLAYPYGSYTSDTVSVASEAGFVAAVTTNAIPVKSSTDRLLLGRFLVDDWDGKMLDKYMKVWIKS